MKSEPEAAGDARPGRVRIPVSQIAVRGTKLDALYDPAMAPTRARILPIADLNREAIENAQAMATLIRAEGGGPLRTFSGGLAHENGWHPSYKARRLVHWEGEAQLEYITAADLDHDVVHVDSECLRVEFPLDGAMVHYTVDVETVGPDGRRRAIEIKRDERDLENPAYRLKLAYVREILRRCDIDFRIVLRSEIFASRQHRRNVEDFASRRFRSIELAPGKRFERYAASNETSTYGELAAAIDPTSQVQGRATVQALVARRRVVIDLTGPIRDTTPVRIIGLRKKTRAASGSSHRATPATA